MTRTMMRVQVACFLLLLSSLLGAYTCLGASSSSFSIKSDESSSSSIVTTNTRAAQSSTASSSSSSLPNLPLGDINVVVLTDTHSWIGGHGAKEELDADYGDVLSFVQRFKEQLLSEPNKDLWFVVNGDWIDGTGLAMNGDASKLVPLLEKMPWDAVNIGNHELYRKSVIQQMTATSGFAEFEGSRYLTSNVVFSSNPSQPLGNHYRILKGRHANVLTFGFLFNMQDADPYVTVKQVESVVKEEWFTSVLRTPDIDAILVLAHMGAKDNLVAVILQAIRKELPDMPVQFITGHTHVRAYNVCDHLCSSFEAGRYLDTVGFVSFPKRDNVASLMNSAAAAARSSESSSPGNTNSSPGAGGGGGASGASGDGVSGSTTGGGGNNTPGFGPPLRALVDRTLQTTLGATTNESDTTTTTTPSGSDVPPTGSNDPTNPASNNATASTSTSSNNADPPATPVDLLFHHVFINASKETLRQTLGVPTLETEDGLDLSNFIKRVQTEMGLKDIVGCTEQNYYLAHGLEQHDSLWRLFRDDIVPHVFSTRHRDAVLFLGKGGWRYDLLAGPIAVDELIAVSPFNETMYVWKNIPGPIIAQMNRTLNNETTIDVVDTTTPSAISTASTTTNRSIHRDLPTLPNYILAPATLPFVVDNPNVTYDLITDHFELKFVQDELNKLYPENKANNDKPIPYEHHTTTSMWIDYFHDTNEDCDMTQGANGKKGSGSGGHHGMGGFFGSSGGSGGGSQGRESDLMRIWMAFIGVLVVVLLGVIYARQRGTQWQRAMREQRQATVDAMDEYEHDHHNGRGSNFSDDYESGSDDDFDAQFV